MIMDDKTLQEIYQFMGEMRREREHRDELLELQATQLVKMEENLEKTNEKVDALVTKITRWESKLGVFMFVASCLFSAAAMFKEQIIAFMKGG